MRTRDNIVHATAIPSDTLAGWASSRRVAGRVPDAVLRVIESQGTAQTHCNVRRLAPVQRGSAAMDPAKLTVPVLREHLAKRGLDTSGLKAVLVARLKDAIAAEAAAPPAAQGDSPAAADEPTPAAPAAAAPVAVPPAGDADEAQPTAAPSRLGRREAGRAKGAAKEDKAAAEQPAPTAPPADSGPAPMETEAPEPAAQEVPQVCN